MSTSGSGYQWIIIKFCFTGDIIFSIPLDLDLSLRNSNSGLEVNQAPTTTGLCNDQWSFIGKCNAEDGKKIL